MQGHTLLSAVMLQCIPAHERMAGPFSRLVLYWTRVEQ